MKAFLLATVSMIALTSVARTAELPDNKGPLSSIPAAGWKVGHIGFEGGTADSDSLTKNVTGPVSVLRLHPDSRIQPSHDFALAAHAQVASPPKTALPAGETHPRAFSINEAISLAVLTNPGVGEASANRRATESTLRQAQGFLLPQVRLNSSIGPEKFTQAVGRPPPGNGTWLGGKETSVVVRQLLFDGFASIHEIWRQAARVNAAAFRALERTELIALDAAEAYIDVVRYLRLVALANQKLIVPVGVLVGNAGWPACVPGGSPLRAPSPASNTVVAGPPGGGIVMVGVAPTFRCGVAGMTAKAIPLCPSGPSRSSGIKPL